eukprot:scaffold501_cov145-Skeletonema_menzelii.AAC.2
MAAALSTLPHPRSAHKERERQGNREPATKFLAWAGRSLKLRCVTGHWEVTGTLSSREREGGKPLNLRNICKYNKLVQPQTVGGG